METNADKLRGALLAWNDNDWDSWGGLWHPDVVIIAPEGWPDGEATNGIEAWKSQAQRLRNSWEVARLDLEGIRSAEDLVLAQMRYTTIGEGTKLPFETVMFGVFFFKEGKVKFGQYFWDLADALELAGLPADDAG